MNENNRTILVVDDDEAGRYTTSRLLRQAGFEVKEASTGAEALKIAAEKPDLVVLDVHLPDINGIEVCKIIKESPDTKDIPVLNLSAVFVDTKSRVTGLDSGADGYLVQPVESDELVATINALLRMKRAEKQAKKANLSITSETRVIPNKTPVILNVDDYEAGRYATTKVLTMAGFIVVEAQTGAEALKIVREKPPDLVLLDVNLPDIDGFEVCRQIKEEHSSKLLPVLHLSATFTDSSAKVKGLEGGADGYLTQPVEPLVLIATIKSLLRLRDLEAEAALMATQWNMTFDAITDAICLLDPEGRILRFNEAFLRLTGKNSNEITGHFCFEIMHMSTTFIENCPFVQARNRGHRGSIDADLKGRSFRISVDPVCYESGRVLNFVHIMSDITELKRTEEQIRRSLAEKVVMLKEIHHRVKNNMQVIVSLLGLQTDNIEDSRVRAIFEESRSRVFSMALVHEKLYQSEDLARIDFRKYLHDLVREIADTYRRKNVHLSVDMKSISLDVTAGIPCGLIVNELISNSLKHAFPEGREGLIRVGINKDNEGNYVLFVEDNGIGFPSEIDFRNTSSLGLKLIKALTGQICGTIELSISEGTRFIITFPGTQSS